MALLRAVSTSKISASRYHSELQPHVFHPLLCPDEEVILLIFILILSHTERLLWPLAALLRSLLDHL